MTTLRDLDLGELIADTEHEILRVLQNSGLDLIAEDLGVVPAFMQRVLEMLDVPGCKVLRWERDWRAEGAPFIDPAAYPARSAAMTGTHDTETLSVWWRELSLSDRTACLALPGFAHDGLTDPEAAWTDRLRDALLTLAYSSGSRDLFLPVQDLFGWDDRINVPGTVGPDNWTWVLRWPADRMTEHPEATRQAAFLAGLSAVHRRGGLH